MKLIPKAEVIRRLNKIYAKVPSFDCKHCHQCSSPIMWFKPEEINIKEFLKLHHLPYLTLSDEEFRLNRMKCPYLENDRCSIYPVRPLVCRLQGTISNLPCPYNSNFLLSEDQYKKIIKELDALTQDVDGIDECFGTRRELNSNFLAFQRELIKPVPF
jgi:uncharacterized protein